MLLHGRSRTSMLLHTITCCLQNPSLVNLVPSCSLCLSSWTVKAQGTSILFLMYPLLSFLFKIKKDLQVIQGFALRVSCVFLFLRFSSFKLSPRSQCPSFAAGSAKYSSQGCCTQNAKVHMQTLTNEGLFNAALELFQKKVLEHIWSTTIS